MTHDMSWPDIVAAEANCKRSGKCPRLGIRELFFEPNPYTLHVWQESHHFYEKGLDRRLVFLAERPVDVPPADDFHSA